MTKKELVAKLADTQGISKASAQGNLDVLLDTLAQVLAKGDSITLPGFGTFTTALQKGKSGKVPGTDKTYTTQDKMVPKFKAGKGLKDRVETGK